jgi:hypothetical protein
MTSRCFASGSMNDFKQFLLILYKIEQKATRKKIAEKQKKLQN